MNEQFQNLADKAASVSQEAATLAEQVAALKQQQDFLAGPDPFIISLSIFILACFVGYYVVWRVTPALHTPLMAVTNAISGIIIVGAIIAVGPEGMGTAQEFGFIAVMLASVNIFGGFMVTQRMLQMYKKKATPATVTEKGEKA